MDIFSSLLGLRSIFGLDARNARLILVDILYEMLRTNDTRERYERQVERTFLYCILLYIFICTLLYMFIYIYVYSYEYTL